MGKPTPTDLLIQLDDTDFVVRVSADDLRMRFAAYQSLGTVVGGGRLFERQGADGPMDNAIEGSPTDDALAFIEGEIKWDGCSNFTFPEQERCMLHRCDRAGLLRIGQLLAAIYDHAATFFASQGVIQDAEPSVAIVLTQPASESEVPRG